MINKTLSYNNEVYRKIIHLGSLLFPILYFFFNYNFFLVFISTTTIFMLILNANYYNIINTFPEKININFIIRKNEQRSFWSASLMIISFLLITLVFPKNIVILSMIITSVSDPIAALLGMKFGVIKLFHNKTLEGSCAFIISTFLITLFYFQTFNIMLFIICVLISLNELTTPMKYDNLTIPIVSSILFFTYSLIK